MQALVVAHHDDGFAHGAAIYVWKLQRHLDMICSAGVDEDMLLQRPLFGRPHRAGVVMQGIQIALPDHWLLLKFSVKGKADVIGVEKLWLTDQPLLGIDHLREKVSYGVNR